MAMVAAVFLIHSMLDLSARAQEPRATSSQGGPIKVKVICSRSAADFRIAQRDGELVMDDARQRLVLKSKERPVDVKYEDIQKVIRVQISYLTAFRTLKTLRISQF
jgi:hypothetical protein